MLPQPDNSVRLRDLTWRFLRALGAAPAEADDLVQEAFVRLLRENERGAAPDDPRAWLFTVARRLFLDLRRGQRRAVSVPWTIAVEAELSQHPCVDGESDWARAARDCVGHLGPRAAQIVQLFYVEGRSRQEIAATLAMTEAGVKTALQRARAALRDCITRRTTTCETKTTTCSTPN